MPAPTMLSLNNSTVFLQAGDFPVDGGHWCFVGEITSAEFLLRPRLTVSDVNSDQTGIVIAWYLDNDLQREAQKLFKQCQVGHTIFILDAVPHGFLDGTSGYRLETIAEAKIVPASYSKLLKLEKHLRSPSTTCDNNCAGDAAKPLKKCSACKVATYDSEACQEEHWKRHKVDCKAYQGLREILEMEDEFENANEAIAFKPRNTPKVPSKPTVLILTLGGEEDMFDRIEKQLKAELKKRAIALTARSVHEALQYLDSPFPISAIICTDQGITERKHKRVLARLVSFVKESGGTVILAAQFSTFVEPLKMERTFKDAWGLPWKKGSYHRTTHFLKPTRSEKLRNRPELEQSYSMKALHLKGMRPEDMVYGPTEQSITQSLVFAPEQITDFQEAPVVFAKVGKGYLGYNGDVNAEEGSTKVILAMMGLA
ncbi:hypothetical protein BOTBODRAFT_191674 [Botryobasidium botryosum FD-172 SS1]|uniref:MYND-type domain-containing protein n=1 Tax=Botryobasidium botryosum (strain FD-172 SS1) TaxID=930990 RepID=A0A067MAA2_BOTB1|nr:hypothetical protein BOTBODRAFT_191674 [Botryobasidium botryosum FD-172 SS1]